MKSVLTSIGLLEKEIFSIEDSDDDAIRIGMEIIEEPEMDEDIRISLDEALQVETAEFDASLHEEVKVVQDFTDALKIISKNGKSMKIKFADGTHFIIDAFTAKKIVAFADRKTLNTAAKTKWGFFELLGDVSLGETPGTYDDY